MTCPTRRAAADHGRSESRALPYGHDAGRCHQALERGSPTSFGFDPRGARELQVLARCQSRDDCRIPRPAGRHRGGSTSTCATSHRARRRARCRPCRAHGRRQRGGRWRDQLAGASAVEIVREVRARLPEIRRSRRAAHRADLRPVVFVDNAIGSIQHDRCWLDCWWRSCAGVPRLVRSSLMCC